MSDFRETLLDRMTSIYGLENPIILDFVWQCENFEENEWNNKILETLVKAHEANPYYGEF